MVKNIAITLDETEHSYFLSLKGNRTWKQIFISGLKSQHKNSEERVD